MQESPYLNDNGMLLERLRRLPFLGAASESHLRKILSLSRIRKYEDGESIIKQHDYDQWVYLLFSGAVRILIKGKEIRRLQEVGATFGEVAALNGKARSASVEAIGPTVCLAIDVSFITESAEPIEQAAFISLLYRLFVDVMAQRLRGKDEELGKVCASLDAARQERDELRRSEKALRHELESLRLTIGNRWIMKGWREP